MASVNRQVTSDSRFLRMMRLAGIAIATTIAWIAAASLLAWLIGRVVSDRYLWSQFLLWIPTPIALGLAALGLLVALRPAKNTTQRRRRRIRWAIMLAALMIYFGFFEHRLFKMPPAAREGLHIMHWNAWPEYGENTVHFLDGVLSLDPDILILSNAWVFPWWRQSRGWIEQHGGTARSMHPFSIITRVPLITARHLVSKDDIVIVMLEFDTTEQLGRTLTIYAVDMPSDLKLARMDLARDARRLLDEIERPATDESENAENTDIAMTGISPDLAIGDFNITRNSAAMRTMFPDMRHAFDEAGYGYGVTFFRIFPLYHIDHILLGESVHATRYDIVNPGVSRHRAQSVRIIPRER